MQLERRHQLLLSPSYGMCDSCKDYVCFLTCITRLELPTLHYSNLQTEQGLCGVPGAASPGSLGNLEHILVHLCATVVPAEKKQQSTWILPCCEVLWNPLDQTSFKAKSNVINVITLLCWQTPHCIANFWLLLAPPPQSDNYGKGRQVPHILSAVSDKDRWKWKRES